MQGIQIAVIVFLLSIASMSMRLQTARILLEVTQDAKQSQIEMITDSLTTQPNVNISMENQPLIKPVIVDGECIQIFGNVLTKSDSDNKVYYCDIFKDSEVFIHLTSKTLVSDSLITNITLDGKTLKVDFSGKAVRGHLEDEGGKMLWLKN